MDPQESGTTGSDTPHLTAARILAAYRIPEHAPFDDALIAAVAQSAEMTVATRNIQHFEPLGVPFLNPWETKATATRCFYGAMDRINANSGCASAWRAKS